MTRALPGRIQVAGVIDQQDADTIISAGADMLGFPLGLKDGREDLGIEQAATIIHRTRDLVTSVCITYLDTASEISALCTQLGTRWVQLHGPVSVAEVQKLRKSDPGLGLIKSLIVRRDAGEQLVDEARRFEHLVDAYITDTFDPDTGRSGATGKTHDWSVSRTLVQRTDLPVILAGGLTPGNVGQAVAEVRPFGVDAHTGVEGADGYKSAAKLAAFVTTALSALP